MGFKLYVITVAVLVIFQDAESESISDDIRNHLGSKTPYRFKYLKDESKIKFPGCESTKMWMVIRHGSRLPSDEDIVGMTTTLKELSQQILSGHEGGKGQLSKEQLSRFANWLSSIDITKEKDLVEEGREEMTQLAKRMHKRFPSIIKSKYNSDTFEFRATPTERAEESAKSFAIGLFDKNAPKVTVTKTSKGDPVLRFYKHCDNWQKQVKKNPNTYAEQKKLGDSLLMNQTLENITQKLGLDNTIDLDTADLIYKTCGFETAWWKDYVSPWCFAFDKDTIKVLEYYHDLKHYLMDGYGNELTSQTACESVKNMFDHLTSKTGPNASFLFAHSGTLLKILTHMSLYKPEAPLTGDFIPEDSVWRLSDIDCFASNLAFVLFECKDGPHILTLHQERVVKLPACKKELCPLDHLQQVFHDTIHNCDHAAICKYNSSNDEL
ncbi:multiple inositol polyphosphate phosphatase 1-like isoform X1 [Leguminivora glycinivorella]|uniref:multiple inositol polyphosphate phosphatase 1-like isoform X1 n=1 Tax=Leguminivora glycinivorella TaxID=1035111 RepID=UPI002010C457|nr:multiple inositol polyphosphate phosphatase 1-like isoform X1 [Leguminivora glycinivorella]